MDLVTAIYEPEDLRYPGVQMVLPKPSFESDYDDIFSEFNHLPTVPTTEPENTPYVMGDIDFSHYNPFKGKKESNSVRNTPAEGDIPKTITEKAIYLMTRLQNELGLTKAQAAGVAGNIKVESEFDPTNTKGDGGKAHGIAQWHPERRKGVDIKNMSYEDQVSYLIKELKSEYTWNNDFGGLAKLKQMATPSEAATLIDKGFERSKGLDREKRKRWAEKFNLLRRGGRIPMFAGGKKVHKGYYRKNDHPVKFNSITGDLTDQITGQTGTLVLPEVVVTAQRPTPKPAIPSDYLTQMELMPEPVVYRDSQLNKKKNRFGKDEENESEEEYKAPGNKVMYTPLIDEETNKLKLVPTVYESTEPTIKNPRQKRLVPLPEYKNRLGINFIRPFDLYKYYDSLQ